MLSNVGIDLLPEDGAQWDCPTLLDINAVDKFLKWLDDNPDFAARLKDERWRIAVLESHVESRPNWTKLKQKLTSKSIELIEYIPGREDEPLVAEIQLAYFGNDATSRQSAQLLAYGRRQSEAGGYVRVISRHRCFRLVPNVQLFFIPDTSEIGQEDDATLLRLLQSLDLHPHVRRVAFQRVLNHDYPVAVSETTKMFIDEVRKIGDAHGLPFAKNVNDQPMVDQALRNEERDATGKKKDVSPAIQLNDMKRPSDKSEQKGYRDIMAGVVSAVRNPTAHAPVDLDFIQDRFGDRRTALKFLCLLSLLFEKLDKRIAPR